MHIMWERYERNRPVITVYDRGYWFEGEPEYARLATVLAVIPTAWGVPRTVWHYDITEAEYDAIMGGRDE